MQNFPLIIECAQSGKPIMLKRHYGSSLRDWLGAAEYILKEGNKKVILCERGVIAPHTHSPTSRFLIDLQVVPAAKEITHLPIIVDPSHATFRREWVESMSLASAFLPCLVAWMYFSENFPMNIISRFRRVSSIRSMAEV